LRTGEQLADRELKVNENLTLSNVDSVKIVYLYHKLYIVLSYTCYDSTVIGVQGGPKK